MTFIKYLFSKDFLKQLLFAGILIVVLTFILMWWLKLSTHHDQKITVPDLSKLSITEVQDKLDAMDLRYEILDSANYNPDYPRYSVIEQIPKAGKFVKENRKIYLTLNPSGYQKIKIPNVVGKTRRQAEPTLRAMGFKIGKISYLPYIARDEVLELRHQGKKISPGETLPKTAVIDLILGDGTGSINPNEEKDEANTIENASDE
jgi:beta-lactam-binding protein with PASTA domain